MTGASAEPGQGHGWVRWNGGAAPVAGDRMVEVIRRYLPEPLTCRSSDVRWSHDQYHQFGAEDVVAFRLVDGVPDARGMSSSA